VPLAKNIEKMDCWQVGHAQIRSDQIKSDISVRYPGKKCFGAPRIHTPNGISISSSVFVGFTLANRETDRHTDRPRYLCNDRPHLTHYDVT